MTPTVEEKVRELLDPVLKREGLSLYDLSINVRPNNSLLRVYIDRPGGVNVSHCENVSNQLSALLDVEDPFPGSYTLEVSSPGLTRKLTKEDHFIMSLGCFVKMAFRKGFEGPPEVQGILEDAGNGKFRIVRDGSSAIEFEFKDVSRARLDLKS